LLWVVGGGEILNDGIEDAIIGVGVFINLLAPEFCFLILAHPVCKM
jgi:hypothetical protein